jgi:hypothetical protein
MEYSFAVEVGSGQVINACEQKIAGGKTKVKKNYGVFLG